MAFFTYFKSCEFSTKRFDKSIVNKQPNFQKLWVQIPTKMYHILNLSLIFLLFYF
jgi:hypothetical protein